MFTPQLPIRARVGPCRTQEPGNPFRSLMQVTGTQQHGPPAAYWTINSQGTWLQDEGLSNPDFNSWMPVPGHHICVSLFFQIFVYLKGKFTEREREIKRNLPGLAIVVVDKAASCNAAIPYGWQFVSWIFLLLIQFHSYDHRKRSTMCGALNFLSK